VVLVDRSDTLFSKALKLSVWLAVAIAILGSLFGYLFYQGAGVYAALAGAGVSALFGTLTILSIWFGGKLSLNGFYAVVLGGWLLKFILFAGTLLALQNAQNFSGPMFFFAVVATVLGGLAIDSWLVLKNRVPTVGK
jgi:hypothetical protein